VWGDEEAQLIQLASEYHPEPPFSAGSPNTAPAHLVTRFRERTRGLLEQRLAAAERAMARRG
jgi:cyclohexyl-isocyanide hydratase